MRKLWRKEFCEITNKPLCKKRVLVQNKNKFITEDYFVQHMNITIICNQHGKLYTKDN